MIYYTNAPTYKLLPLRALYAFELTFVQETINLEKHTETIVCIHVQYTRNLLSCSSRLAQPGIMAVDQHWFRRQTSHEPNQIYKFINEMCLFFFAFWILIVQLEQRSLTEWIQPAKLIWLGLNSDLIRLMWRTVSQPGLTPTTLASFEITNLDQATLHLIFFDSLYILFPDQVQFT